MSGIDISVQKPSSCLLGRPNAAHSPMMMNRRCIIATSGVHAFLAGHWCTDGCRGKTLEPSQNSLSRLSRNRKTPLAVLHLKSSQRAACLAIPNASDAHSESLTWPLPAWPRWFSRGEQGGAACRLHGNAHRPSSVTARLAPGSSSVPHVNLGIST